MTGTLLLATIGAVMGAASLLLHWKGYRRDRPDLLVELQWNADAIHEHGMRSPVKQRFGHIIVTNRGRRPVNVTFIGLQLPGHRSPSASWLDHSVKLDEGDPSIIIKIPQDSVLDPFLAEWKKIHATVGTNTGSWHKSKPGWERPLIVPGFDFNSAGRLQDFTALREAERQRAAATRNETVNPK